VSALPARGLFDIADDVAYLNCAYMGPLPRRSAEIGIVALARKATPWLITTDQFFAPVSALRGALARIIGGDEEGVAITPSVSYGTATAAANVAVTAGARILVLADQFPSNVYPWRALADRSGARVEAVARPADSDWTAAVLAALGPDVALVAVPAVHWTDGTRVDLAALRSATHRVGAALVVDGAQAVGAVPFDVASLQPDFLVGATYKWLLGPYSIGFCWVHPDHRSGRPIEENWMARAGSEDFSRLVDYVDSYQPGARRFDVGEVANFALVPTATASVELLLELGIEAIAGHARALTDQVAVRAAERGLQVAGPAVRSPHLVGLRLPAGIEPRAVAAGLAARQVHVSVRGDSIRVSAHVFNTFDDVARLVAALDELGVGARSSP
jgi:selenocysteine lyase/cysteine desulfurase